MDKIFQFVLINFQKSDESLKLESIIILNFIHLIHFLLKFYSIKTLSEDWLSSNFPIICSTTVPLFVWKSDVTWILFWLLKSFLGMVTSNTAVHVNVDRFRLFGLFTGYVLTKPAPSILTLKIS